MKKFKHIITPIEPYDFNYILYSGMKHILNQTKDIKSKRLYFKNGQSLGDVDIRQESGVSRRKLLRIIEKKVCQNYHFNGNGRNEDSNCTRYNERHRLANTLRNIYGMNKIKYLFSTCSDAT